MIYIIKQKYTKHTTIYTVIQKRTKRIWKNVINETAIYAANFIWSVYLVIMLDTLLLRPSLHFTPLHYATTKTVTFHGHTAKTGSWNSSGRTGGPTVSCKMTSYINVSSQRGLKSLSTRTSRARWTVVSRQTDHTSCFTLRITWTMIIHHRP
jgi:hypothetical protein